ncbi:hypothetical protein T02_4229 [Trichinella nativa]|uniref:Uncharacterized protein n=1 Tax=Trichinella nativa TaxID=6335 RepID=A0A0V1KT74_9BILA|nr:hypothetical protein T02_4229 [Trichinella nativa]
MNRIVIHYSCMMLHPSSIRFITFIVLRRQISKKRVEAVDMRGTVIPVPENHPFFVVVDGVGSDFVRACDQVKCEYRRRSYDLNV